MPQGIRTINLSLPYKMGSVNCYLLETKTGYILVDTGCSNRRTELEKELENADYKLGNLKLFVLTHGDFDHVGNAAYLRKKFGTKTAIHYDDSGMVERGNMFWNRTKSNILIRMIAPILFRFGKSERFEPDVYTDDRDDLSEQGFNARVLHIPGHSKGSIGILTSYGDLFCGDLLENTDKPDFNFIMYNPAVANASVQKLNKFSIKTVYPGHGKSFPMEVFTKNNR